MLKKLSGFIVDKRYLVLALMLALAVAGLICSQFVRINDDMTKYLPDDSDMKIGLDIMAEEFPDDPTANTIRVMIDDLSDSEKTEALQKLRAVEHVDSVDYDPDSADYNKDNHTLYILHMSCAYGSEEEAAIYRALESGFDGETITWKNDEVAYAPIPTFILVSVVIVILIILFAMCRSWIEPFLFLAAIGVAVVINGGTNLLLGNVANITNNITAILQMVLSMDYSIILMNRYRQEKALEPDKKIAMKSALANAFPAVASSALTTVVGLLMLVFMSFKIGMDLGVVLAKGVFISMICVLTILPALVLACDKALTKTAKKTIRIPTDWAARFSHRLRFALTGLFVLLFIGVFIAQQQTSIDYSLVKNDSIDSVFPRNNMMVMVYENRDEDRLDGLYEALDGDDRVKSVMSAAMFGRQCTSGELCAMLGQMSSSMKMDPSLIDMLYYMRYTGGETGTMTVREFVTFLTTNVMNNETFASYIDEDMKTRAMASMGSLMIEMQSDKQYTAPEMGELLSGIFDGLDPGMIGLLYLYKDSVEKSDPAWTMSAQELLRYFAQDVLSDPRFSALIDDDMRQAILGAQTSLDAGKAQLAGENHSRLVITTTYPDESKETTAFIEMLKEYGDRLEGRYYLIGSAAMASEMQKTFGGEYLFITLLTALAIFLIVLITFRSIPIPAILVLVVQCGIFITITVTDVISGGMYYLALLIVECILMGATIDYGILFTNYYCSLRKEHGVREALKRAYSGSTHTILTSGLILISVTAICGGLFEDKTTQAIIGTLSIGAFSAVVLILFLLPGILSACDRLVIKKKYRDRQPSFDDE